MGSCRKEIDRCRPFFIGILGDCYGSIIPERNISYVHDEIEYGVFDSLKKQKTVHAFFFFRSSNVYEVIPSRYKDQFCENSAEKSKKLAILKNSIYIKKLPVYEYSCYWNPHKIPLWSPKQKGCFDSLGQFEKKVLEI